MSGLSQAVLCMQWTKLSFSPHNNTTDMHLRLHENIHPAHITQHTQKACNTSTHTKTTLLNFHCKEDLPNIMPPKRNKKETSVAADSECMGYVLVKVHALV